MTWNDHCSSLLAIGSYRPGEVNHERFADLPGTWRKGLIVSELVDPPDGVGMGEREPVEAWMIEVEASDAEMFTPAYHEQERRLKARWAELDRRMGPAWGRESFRWWPEGVEPKPSSEGMLVVNMYVPIEHFAYLKHRPDTPDPEVSIAELWRQVRLGEAEYEPALFLGLLKDATRAEAEALFGELPRGAEFVAKWGRFVRDHAMFDGSVLRESSESTALYVQPRVRNATSPETLMRLAKRELAQKVELLGAVGEADLAAQLARVEVVWGGAGGEQDEGPDLDEHPASEALDRIDDLLLEAAPTDHWYYCLMEAAYGVAADFSLRDWLMAPWLELPVDLEPAYRLWRAGGRVRLVGGSYRVTEVERRGAP